VKKPRVLDDSELGKVAGGGGCDTICNEDEKNPLIRKPAGGRSGGLTGDRTDDADDDPFLTQGGPPNPAV